MENGNERYCGNTIPPTTGSGCSTACRGNPAGTCSGRWLLTVDDQHHELVLHYHYHRVPHHHHHRHHHHRLGINHDNRTDIPRLLPRPIRPLPQRPLTHLKLHDSSRLRILLRELHLDVRGEFERMLLRDHLDRPCIHQPHRRLRSQVWWGCFDNMWWLELASSRVHPYPPALPTGSWSYKGCYMDQSARTLGGPS